MGLILDVEVDGGVGFTRHLRKFEASVNDFTPLWNRFRRTFYYTELLQFASEGAYNQSGWAKLSPAYGRWKEKNFPGRPILVLSGDLKASLTSAQARGSYFKSELKQMEIGSRIPYGIYHQAGSARMPARQPIYLSAFSAKAYTDQIIQWIRGQWEASR